MQITQIGRRPVTGSEPKLQRRGRACTVRYPPALSASKEGSPLPVRSSTRRHLMTSEPVRDPWADHLLTPQNCALIIIDYQPTQIRSIRSMDQDLLVNRVARLARFGMLYRLPVVLSTVNVSTGRN